VSETTRENQDMAALGCVKAKKQETKSLPLVSKARAARARLWTMRNYETIKNPYDKSN
jgi:hypothetical protein